MRPVPHPIVPAQPAADRPQIVVYALDVTIAQRAELDYLIYNDPLAYADLILNGDPEKYLKQIL